MSAQPTTTSPPTACHIMEQWDQFDPDNAKLAKAGSKFKSSYAVKKFVHDMGEAKSWRGEAGVREYPAEKKKKKPATSKKDSASPSPSAPLKKVKSNPALPSRKRSSPGTSPLHQKKVWTKEQQEVATAKKAQEAADAACVGVRRSSRARVPTEKVLDA